MENIFKELEELLLFYRKEDFKKLLDENYEEIGVSGKIYNKAMEMDYVNSHQALSEKKLIISDFSSKEIGENLIMNSFKTTDKSTNKAAFRTSLWKKVNGNWQIFFHQGTSTSE
ncbi:DUF4440 domain-containing protein [Liquorilactobacillus hordei]|uniref:DUF4440 domain-containing protein n=1 Tax=Liquorilactobacillus hordei TaxID=468911 RepID=UPI0039E9EACF